MPFKRVKDIRSTRSEVGLRFSLNQKKEIIKEVEQGATRSDVCQRYGIAYITLSTWLKEAGSLSYQASRKSFSTAEKRSIVRAVSEGRITKDQAYAIHHVSRQTLANWIKAFKEEEKAFTPESEHSMPPHDHIPPHQDELQQARLKVKALETLIDIAEEQFKINIRKKPGAKQ